MPRISNQKKDKISEQILHHLFTISPNTAFTSDIAQEIARDEEFVKSMLQDLHSKKLIVLINKNSQGDIYSRRQRWRLSNEAYDVYSKHQNTLKNNNNLYNVQSFEE